MAASSSWTSSGRTAPVGLRRIAEEQGLGARRDRGLDGRRVQREVVLEAGRDEAGDAAREHDGRHVGHVRRLVEDDLVARVAGRAQGEVERLATPRP